MSGELQEVQGDDRVQTLAYIEKIESGYFRDVDFSNSALQGEISDALKLLTDYECWQSYSDLAISLAQAAPDHDKLDYYKMSAVAWGRRAHDETKCAETIVRALKDCKVHYDEFFITLLQPSVEPENYFQESAILKEVISAISKSGEKKFLELCLERLSMIYDKKLHLDAKHHETQEKLLKLNKHNHKALKYFKMRYHQMGEWQKVVDTLATLIATSTHGMEKARYAMEQATILLFYLDQPGNCLATLDKHVGDSFDSNKIRLAALRASSRYQEAIDILERMFEATTSVQEKATILFYYGQIASILENFDLAMEKFKLSNSSWPRAATLLEITRLAVAQKDTEEIKAVLQTAKEYDDQEISDKASALLERMV